MSQDFSNEDSSNWKFPDPEKVSEFLSPWKGICPSATTFHSLFFNPSYPINVKVQLEKTAELKCSWNMAVDEVTNMLNLKLRLFIHRMFTDHLEPSSK